MLKPQTSQNGYKCLIAVGKTIVLLSPWNNKECFQLRDSPGTKNDGIT
jgi:hypothetical protein